MRLKLVLPFEDLWGTGCEDACALEANPEEPQELDFTKGSVRNAMAAQHIELCAHCRIWREQRSSFIVIGLTRVRRREPDDGLNQGRRRQGR